MTTTSSALVLAAASDGTSVSPAHLLVGVLLIGLVLALAGLFVAVLASILRSDLGAGTKLLWVIFVFCVPVLAWFAWYLLGRPAAPGETAPA